MEHAVQVIRELAEVWDEAEKVYRRDLLRLAVRKIAIDVPQGRVVTIEPHPVFVPLLRKVALLREIDFGVFSPVWPQALVEVDVLPMMESVTQLRRGGVTRLAPGGLAGGHEGCAYYAVIERLAEGPEGRLVVEREGEEFRSMAQSP